MKDVKNLMLNFINILEGSKTICKAQHWNAPNLNVNDKRGAHLYLDDFLEIIIGYQDTLAECSQGIIGVYLNPSTVKGIQKNVETPLELVDYIIQNVSFFYQSLPQEVIYSGIKSETETFIKDLNKYNYLFSLV